MNVHAVNQPVDVDAVEQAVDVDLVEQAVDVYTVEQSRQVDSIEEPIDIDAIEQLVELHLADQGVDVDPLEHGVDESGPMFVVVAHRASLAPVPEQPEDSAGACRSGSRSPQQTFPSSLLASGRRSPSQSQ